MERGKKLCGLLEACGRIGFFRACLLGLGRFLGMDVHKVKDSDDPGQDLLARLQWVVRHGKEYEFVHVHTKATDAAAHTKDPINKVKAIESLDRGIRKDYR